MKAHQVVSIKEKEKRRIARGNAAGRGTTAGRGTKGQRSRTKRGNIPTGFEGGQMPIKMRIPKKKGFRSFKRKEFQVVNVGQLSDKFKDGDKIDQKKLLSSNLIKDIKKPVKILGDGKITKNLEVIANSFSKNAIKKIKAANGKTKII